MTTLIDVNGNVKSSGSGTVVQGLYRHSYSLDSVKVIRTSNVDPSAGVTISWQSAIWDTSGYIASFPTTNIVIPRDGWYSVTAYINTTSATAHAGRMDISVNGVSVSGVRVQMGTPGGLMNAQSLSLSNYRFVSGNIITIDWDTSGIVVDLHTGGEAGCSCTVWRTG